MDRGQGRRALITIRCDIPAVVIITFTCHVAAYVLPVVVMITIRCVVGFIVIITIRCDIAAFVISVVVIVVLFLSSGHLTSVSRCHCIMTGEWLQLCSYCVWCSA